MFIVKYHRLETGARDQVLYILVRMVEYTCYALIFGAIGFMWIGTP